MKVEITVANKTENYILFEEIQNWDNGLCETTGGVFKAAQKEYGRCVSQIYIDSKGGESKQVGWVFEKKCRYTDAHESYIQETWVTPLLSYKVKHIKGYALA